MYGAVGGVHWTVWSGFSMSWCCRGCGLGLPSLPVSTIYTPSWCPRACPLKWLAHLLMLQWLWCWFARMISRLFEIYPDMDESSYLPAVCVVVLSTRRHPAQCQCPTPIPHVFPRVGASSTKSHSLARRVCCLVHDENDRAVRVASSGARRSHGTCGVRCDV